MRIIEVSLTWPDGTAVRATLNAISPDLGAQVVWTGDTARIEHLPAEIAPGLGGVRCDVGSLLALSKLHALDTDAEHQWTSDGAYEIWAQ